MTSFLEDGETGDFVKAFLSGEDPRASAHLLRSTMTLMYTTQESPATRPNTERTSSEPHSSWFSCTLVERESLMLKTMKDVRAANLQVVGVISFGAKR